MGCSWSEVPKPARRFSTIVDGKFMQKRFRRILQWACLSGACLAQFEGCAIDPDIPFRAALTFGSDLAIFLLDNLVASL